MPTKHSANLPSSLQHEPSNSFQRLPPRKNVSSACQACKRSRAKCSNGDPCQRCAARDIPCLREEDTDQRRKEIRKRNIQDLQDDSDILHGLVETIRDSQDVQVMEIVSVIRSTANTDEIKAFIRQAIDEAERKGPQSSPQLGQLRARVEEVQSRPLRQRRKMDISRMIDEPPCRVSATPWTSVTDDDVLVSNLLSMWLAWDRPFFDWVDEEVFLHDMEKGSLDSDFCSPFMVNALLANVCPYSDYEEAQTKHGMVAPLTLNFLHEAERLLQETNGKPSITTAQGLGFLYLATSKIGYPSKGYPYLCQATAMCKILESKEPELSSGPVPRQLLSLSSRVLQKTYWGLFNMLVVNCIVLRKPCTPVASPRFRMVEPGEISIKSVPYPLSVQPVEFYLDELRHHFCSLSLISRDLVTVLFDETKQLSRLRLSKPDDTVIDFHRRLMLWHNLLPAHLRANQSSPPSVLIHEAHFYMLIMILFNALTPNSSRISAKGVVLEADKISLNAALKVCDICRTFASLYGSSLMSSYFMIPIGVTLDTLVGRTEIQAYGTAITDLCSYLKDISRRWPITMISLRAFQLCAQQNSLRLPPATERLFQEFEKEEWSKSELQQKMSSAPVVGDRKTGNYKDVYDLSDFFDVIGEFKIDTEDGD